jgi:hypothetical protein
MKMTSRWGVPLLAATVLLALTAGSAQAAGQARPASAPGVAAAGVPAGFEPASASFVSPAWGVVLGGVGCSPSRVCLARLAATADGGTRWHLMKAPRVWISEPAAVSSHPQVSQVLFASRRDGWLYYQYGSAQVWATHDGGAHWSRISLGGDIQAMAASAGTVYAVVSRPSGDELFRSPAGRDAWARVGTMTGEILAVSGRAAWFGTSTYLWATAGGVHWHRYPFACPAGTELAAISAASRLDVAFLCDFAEGTYHTVKDVLLSVNGGRTEHLTGQAPLAGDVYGFAVPARNLKVITIAVVTPGPSYVYRSGNGGKTWAEIAIPGTTGGVGLNSLSYVSRTVGWVVVSRTGFPGPHQLLRTSDAGRTWHAVTF